MFCNIHLFFHWWRDHTTLEHSFSRVKASWTCGFIKVVTLRRVVTAFKTRNVFYSTYVTNVVSLFTLVKLMTLLPAYLSFRYMWRSPSLAIDQWSVVLLASTLYIMFAHKACNSAVKCPYMSICRNNSCVASDNYLPFFCSRLVFSPFISVTVHPLASWGIAQIHPVSVSLMNQQRVLFQWNFWNWWISTFTKAKVGSRIEWLWRTC